MSYTSNTIPINPRLLDDLEAHIKVISASLEAALSNFNTSYSQATNSVESLIHLQSTATNKFASELDAIENSFRALIKRYQVLDREMSQLPGVLLRLEEIKDLLTKLEAAI